VNSLNPLANHVSSLTTEAVQASAHRLRTSMTRFGERNAASVPTESSVSNPLSLSARRRDPYFGFAAAMDNRKSPLGVEFQDVAVRNQLRFQWIYNFNNIVSKHQFRSYPNDVSSSPKNETKNYLDKSLPSACHDHKTICCKESNQYQRSARPREVASGTKSFIHTPSIAGDSK